MNKKTLSTKLILGIVIAIVTLLFFLTYIVSHYHYVKIKSKETNCRYFFETITSNKEFFTAKGPSEFMTNSIVNICPSQTVSVSENSMQNAEDLINSCFSMTGAGKNILENTVFVNKAICLYCGEITTKDNIETFNKQLAKKLKNAHNSKLFSNDTEYKNTNKYFLTEKNIPQKLSEGESISVFYYIYKPNFNDKINEETGDFDPQGYVDFTENYYRQKLTEFFYGYNNIATTLIATHVFSPNTDSLGGIVLSKQNKLNGENFVDKKVEIKGPFRDCLLYVPLNHFS